MNLRQLEYFLTVTAEGSFSRAAAVLHMTQPPLSQSVLQLEKQLGVQLLVRHRQGVSPTAAGELLAAQGQQLLRWSERVEEQVKAVGQGIAGRLHIASVPTFAWAHLPPLLKAYAAKAPGVAVELSDPEPAKPMSRTERYVVDRVARDPNGVWYPTIVRRESMSGAQGKEKPTEETWTFSVDFKTEIPDDLFKVELSQ